jgi:hypothetical protein
MEQNIIHLLETSRTGIKKLHAKNYTMEALINYYFQN